MGRRPARTSPNQETHRAFLDALGVDPARSVFQYDQNGHIGSADPLVNLEELERDGRIGAGDLVIAPPPGRASPSG
ncbi:3-oxoacyl-[acyl-carrier-protein] synthase III C-terminal domain-containing protein [Streptomyces sp. NPDC048581]|uniref:3-oxoacyl-[acyl-carrier-protein] synthase III C-terminal domain-containing protein n=1 Tax=unclassified Streptomyces TaxID=2593676 RepID=UPI00372432DA